MIKFIGIAFLLAIWHSILFFNNRLGASVILFIIPLLGFIITTFPPSVHLLSIHASFKYFSAIPWIVLSIVKIKSSPSTASIYSSEVSPISPPVASLNFVIFPLLLH